ncbi:MAG: hypothetical protein FJ147_17210 [Deltaproteobacteria bacterium]|nr:hypothetical protein [Deltaproteobacteria bacterium]
MWNIATATVAYPDVGWCLGIGLWILLIVSVGGIILVARSQRQTIVQSVTVPQSRTENYQHAA